VQVLSWETILPRVADASLSDRILNATYDLLHKRGIHAVTLREVAMRAKTTTPTLYARFATKEDLLLALADRARHELVSEITKEPTLLKACKRYLEVSIERPADYKLIFEVGWPKMFAPQAGIQWSRERFAELYGGYPKDYAQVVDCLWMELHGCAGFLLKASSPEVSKQLFKSCMYSCAIIIQNAKLFCAKARG
jgi:AcrR family transcriptional regulator